MNQERKYDTTIENWITTYQTCMIIENYIGKDEMDDEEVEQYLQEKSKLMSCLISTIVIRSITDKGEYNLQYAQELFNKIMEKVELVQFDIDYVNECLVELVEELAQIDEDQSEDEQ